MIVLIDFAIFSETAIISLFAQRKGRHWEATRALRQVDTLDEQ
jgi:hypothetical protein